MKTSLLATAAAATIALLATSAQAQVAGHVGANYARTVIDIDGPNPDLDNYQVEGAAGFKVGGLNALVDGTVTNIGGDVNDQVDFAFTGHLNANLGNSLVGGFFGVNATEDLTVWALGAEGQTNLNEQFTLYGQAALGYSDELNDAFIYGLRAEARYFVTPNVKLQGQAGWTKVDTDDFGSTDVWTVGAEGEYQFADTPWSVLAGYDYADADGGYKSHTFRIGGRYTFGGATLKQRNDSGADFSSIRKLLPALNEANAF